MRPTGVTILAILNWVGAVCAILIGLGLFLGFGFLSAAATLGIPTVLGLLGVAGGLIFAFFAAIAVLIGWGLWTLQDWARITEIVLFALSLLMIIPRLFHPVAFAIVPLLIRLAIDAFVIWYLVQPQVRAAFRRTV